MKCLSIKQPWASLIVNGYKEYEFRTWKTKFRGKIYIHASLSTDSKNMDRFKEYNLEYIKGAIIGEAEITGCVYVDNELKKELLTKNSLVYQTSSNYGFKLENIKMYDKPIYCKGALSFWEYKETDKK